MGLLHAMFFNLEAMLEFLICETEEEPRQAEKETRAAGCGLVVGQKLAGSTQG